MPSLEDEASKVLIQFLLNKWLTLVKFLEFYVWKVVLECFFGVGSLL